MASSFYFVTENQEKRSTFTHGLPDTLQEQATTAITAVKQTKISTREEVRNEEVI
ncbi:hypothetical protein SAMN03159341_11514 [Paenibacillus sp. 1_12]|uniref:hypothetical protein n=1 Tax=Paenibacillus sp. 1_12 TaxID=1566278 RepID=UPI0008F3A965|nr:hypothetical protein [Paenibacillus sp. 1_12]SFM05313.1 hypothetical protein SAMN03159341_11514 [Paenibacillus sp. 1_12]